MQICNSSTKSWCTFTIADALNKLKVKTRFKIKKNCDFLVSSGIKRNIIEIFKVYWVDNLPFTYRVTSYTWPCVSGTLYKVTCSVYACTVAYTRQVTFYKVLEKHGHVSLVRLYIHKGLSVIYELAKNVFITK